MGKILAYLKGIMADSEGSPSSKRLVTLLCVFLVAMGFVSNLFWDYTVEEFMFNSIMYIVIAGLGISGAEKFSKKNKE
jgi:hypothetical protein